MSDTKKDKEFLDMADAFIALANKQGETIDKGKVSAAFLYAAARFNTFIVAGGAADVEEFEGYKFNATQYFIGEYEKMLEEHMEDYTVNFGDFIKPDKKAKTVN